MLGKAGSIHAKCRVPATFLMFLLLCFVFLSEELLNMSLEIVPTCGFSLKTTFILTILLYLFYITKEMFIFLTWLCMMSLEQRSHDMGQGILFNIFFKEVDRKEKEMVKYSINVTHQTYTLKSTVKYRVC